MRILFLRQPGTNSRSIFDGMIRGFAAAGHEPLVLELAPFWAAYRQKPDQHQALLVEAASALGRLVREHRPDASVAMWANGLTSFAGGTREGKPASVFDLLDLPHLLYWLDAPHWASEGSLTPLFGSPVLKGPMLLHAINNPGMAAEMTGVLGFGRTLALPYAIDEGVFRPYPEEPRAYDLVVSCGPGDPDPTPLELAELAADEPDLGALRRARAQAIAPDLAALAREGGHDATHDLLTALLDTQLAKRAVPMLERLVALAASRPALAPAATALVQRPALWVRASGLIRRVESFERAFTIAWLSRRCRLAAFGRMNPAWPVQGEVVGDVPFEDMARWYSRGHAALNVMRWQDDVGVNLKPLEASASGVVCLCAAREGLGMLLEPGREVLSFESLPGALTQVRTLRDSPSRALDLGLAARARVLGSHRWVHRAATLAEALAGLRTVRA